MQEGGSFEQAPVQMPQIPQGGFDPNSGPQQVPQMANQASGFESEGKWSKSVKRSHQTRATTRQIMSTRDELVKYLQQNGVDLLTSAVEFQRSGDFIASSYVVYKDHGDRKEPLEAFLERYPSVRPVAEQVKASLTSLQGGLNVITQPNPEQIYQQQPVGAFGAQQQMPQQQQVNWQNTQMNQTSSQPQQMPQVPNVPQQDAGLGNQNVQPQNPQRVQQQIPQKSQNFGPQPQNSAQ